MGAKVNGSYATFAESLREVVIDAASQAIKPLQDDIDERFAKIDEKFAKIDEKFAKIDERFAQQRINLSDDIKDILAEQRSDI